jgi:flagellar hook-basal body complex protein FliE
MSPITSIHFPAAIDMPSLPRPTAQPSSGFESALQNAVGQVENSRAVANSAIQKFISGENQELHTTVLATQQAELQFEMLMQVRNKVVSAYEEIMRIQL